MTNILDTVEEKLLYRVVAPEAGLPSWVLARASPAILCLLMPPTRFQHQPSHVVDARRPFSSLQHVKLCCASTKFAPKQVCQGCEFIRYRGHDRRVAQAAAGVAQATVLTQWHVTRPDGLRTTHAAFQTASAEAGYTR
jgi:hypothetical protein